MIRLIKRFLNNMATSFKIACNILYQGFLNVVWALKTLVNTIAYYCPLWLPVSVYALTILFPQAYVPLMVASISFLLVAHFSNHSFFKAHPKRDVLSDFTIWFQGVITYLTLYRKNNWLGKGDGNNLKEYYDSLTSAVDLSPEELKLDYDAWFRKHHGDKSKYTSKQAHKIWLRHNYAKIFQGLVIRDEFVHAKNEYNQELSPHVFHIKHKNPIRKSNKHLVMFLGRRLSAEDRIEEINYLAYKTGMHVHVMNYPRINDTKGMGYTEADLVRCGSAMINALLAKDSQIVGVKPKDIVLFGNCIGASIAEATFQDFKRKNIRLSGRVLSNNYAYFKPGVRSILLSNIETILGLRFCKPWKRNLYFWSLCILLSPIIIPLLILVEFLPLFGWKNSPHATVKGQGFNALLMGRHDDGILTGKTRHIDHAKNTAITELEKKYNKALASDPAVVQQQDEHWMAKSLIMLKKQARSADTILTKATYAQKSRMKNICNEPHFADFKDMGVRKSPNSTDTLDNADDAIMDLIETSTKLQDIHNARHTILNFMQQHRMQIHQHYVGKKKAPSGAKSYSSKMQHPVSKSLRVQ